MPKLNRHAREKQKNSWNPWSRSDGWKVEEVWRKVFVEKISFEPGEEERRSNGWWQWWWRKWRTDRSDESDKSSWSVGRRSSVGSWFQRQGDAWRKDRLLTLERKRKVGERRLRHLKNECYDGGEQRLDYIDMQVEWWWRLCMWEKEAIRFFCLFDSCRVSQTAERHPSKVYTIGLT